MTTQDLVLRGRSIKEDATGYICLNDLHDLSELPETKSPTKWRSLPTTRELEKALTENSRFSAIIANSPTKSAAYSKRGRSGGTFAHHILALAYAEYLSPHLAIEVKDTYIRLRSADVEFIGEVLKKADEARKWQGTRDASKAARERFTSVLADRDCEKDIGFVTNAIYVALLGKKAPQLKLAMGLPARANLRDNLDLKTLVQTMATEVMASERIEDDPTCTGKFRCYNATARSASFIKDAFDRERADRPKSEVPETAKPLAIEDLVTWFRSVHACAVDSPFSSAEGGYLYPIEYDVQGVLEARFPGADPELIEEADAELAEGGPWLTKDATEALERDAVEE